MPDLFVLHDVVFVKGVGQHLTHVREMTDQEVLRLALLIEETVERCLEGKAIHDVELTPEHDTSRLLFRPLYPEFTREESEQLIFLGHELGQHAHPQVPCIMNRELRSIHEHILLSTVAMHVDVCENLILRLHLQVWLDICKYFLDSADDGMQLRMRRVVSPVQVVARHGHSVVSRDDSVRVGAWYYFENDALSQIVGNGIFRIQNELDEAFHHER